MSGVFENLHTKWELFRLRPDLSLWATTVIVSFCFIVSSFFLGTLFERKQRAASELQLSGAFEFAPWTPEQLARSKGDFAEEHAASSVGPADQNFAATQSGKVYYPKDCKGLHRIKPENRIRFATAALAESAGYSRAKNCK